MKDSVLHYFYEISKIPRPTGKEQRIADYLMDFAKDRSLYAFRDSANNVLIKKEASKGKENAPALLLQGHTDMVCEKNAGTIHDFDNDGIRILKDGDLLRADGTTLGADNGYAVAVMLSILDDVTLVHPPLECLFTTAEEGGLDGMRAFDPSVLSSRTMLNLDSCDETVATAACAGGVRTDFTRTPETASAAGALLRLSVSGLMGGHSGEDIDKGRGNALCLCARLYTAADSATPLCIVSMQGGNKDNAIPRECAVTFVTEDATAAVNAIRQEEARIRPVLSAEDSAFSVEVDVLKTAATTNALTKKESRQLIDLIRLVPAGIQKMSQSIPGLVETSSNTAIVHTDTKSILVTASSRSSVEAELDDLCSRLNAVAALCNFTANQYNRYPGWEFTTGSGLQKVYLETYRALFGSDAKIIGIHAGLECGIMKKALPDMDILSIGPNIYDLHTPDERMSLSSAKKVYRLLLAVLEALT